MREREFVDKKKGKKKKERRGGEIVCVCLEETSWTHFCKLCKEVQQKKNMCKGNKWARAQLKNAYGLI